MLLVSVEADDPYLDNDCQPILSTDSVEVRLLNKDLLVGIRIIVSSRLGLLFAFTSAQK